MAESEDTNTGSPSTTWVWKRVKVRGTPAGRANRPAGAARWWGLSARDRKARITLTIHHRGGAESWWLVEARGRRGAFPGVMCLEDVMAEINRSPEFYGDGTQDR